MDNKNIIIPGRLESVATEGIVTGAKDIYDDDLEMWQDDINQIAISGGGGVDLPISSSNVVHFEKDEELEHPELLQEEINNEYISSRVTINDENFDESSPKVLFAKNGTTSIPLWAIVSCSIPSLNDTNKFRPNVELYIDEEEIGSDISQVKMWHDVDVTPPLRTIQYHIQYNYRDSFTGSKEYLIETTYPIYYGRDLSDMTQDSTPKLKAEGQYSIKTNSGDYLYFEFPRFMGLPRKLELVDSFNTTLQFEEVPTTRRDLEGNLYRAIKTVNARGDGTFTYKIS